MGKTTFMINLYYKYKVKRDFLPKNFKYDIKLLPIGYKGIINEIKAIENKEQTILLLDAFDEDISAIDDYKLRMKEILTITYQFRQIVITCRTHFFPSKEEEPHETGYFCFAGKMKK